MENSKVYIGAPFGEALTPICESNHSMGLSDSGMELSAWDGMTRGNSYGRFFARESRYQDDAGRIPLPGQTRLNAFHHFACGALSVEYSSNIPRRIRKELSELSTEIAPISSRILGVEKVSRVGILACEDMQLLLHVYDCFYRLNIQTDLLPAARRDFRQYDYLVVPALPDEDNDLTAALCSFVEGGGHLFAMCGNPAATGMAPSLARVFGADWEEWTSPEELTIAELDVICAERMELLQLTTAESFARYAGPGWERRTAMTLNRFGKGAAAYLGCMVDENLEKVILKLLHHWCVVIPTTRYPVVEKRGFSAFGKTITYLLNYSTELKTVAAPGCGVELLTGRTVIEGQPLKLEPFGVLILEGEH